MFQIELPDSLRYFVKGSSSLSMGLRMEATPCPFSFYAHRSRPLAVLDGALSCMKIILLQKAQFFFSVRWEKSQSETPHIFPWSFSHPKGPTSSLLMIPPHNMSPLLPCWRCSHVGTWCPFTNHPTNYSLHLVREKLHSTLFKNES